MKSAPFFPCATALAGLLLFTAGSLAAQQPGTPKEVAPHGAGQLDHDTGRPASVCAPSKLGSPYIPVDSWVYPAVLRLYSLGFTKGVYLGMRPWTQQSVSNMLEETGDRIEDAEGDPGADEARTIYTALTRELHYGNQGPCGAHESASRIESVYSVARAISGTPLRDSYHLGSTIVNDYGRPYANGFNNYSGASGYASAGRFLVYARGEFHGAPSSTGYSTALAQALSKIDVTTYLDSATGLPYNQATIPQGPLATVTDGRVMEAYVSAQYFNHVISFGKQDDWLGPGLGGGMAYSNNAEKYLLLPHQSHRTIARALAVPPHGPFPL